MKYTKLATDSYPFENNVYPFENNNVCIEMNEVNSIESLSNNQTINTFPEETPNQIVNVFHPVPVPLQVPVIYNNSSPTVVVINDTPPENNWCMGCLCGFFFFTLPGLIGLLIAREKNSYVRGWIVGSILVIGFIFFLTMIPDIGLYALIWPIKY